MTDLNKNIEEIMEQLQASKGSEELTYGINISELDLSFKNFEEISVSGLIAHKVNLRASSLEYAVLDDCEFDDGMLESAIFTYAAAFDCSFNRVNFKQANLRGAKIIMSYCLGSCFDEADFSHAELGDTSFDNCSLKDCDFSEAQLESIYFRNSDLTGVDFSNTTLEKVDFTNAKLDDVIWEGANIKDSIFDEGVKEKIEKLK